MLRKAVLNPTIANPTIMSMIQNVSNSSSSAAAEEVPAPVDTQASMSYDADIMSIIMNNEYVKSCVSNKKKIKTVSPTSSVARSRSLTALSWVLV